MGVVIMAYLFVASVAHFVGLLKSFNTTFQVL